MARKTKRLIKRRNVSRQPARRTRTPQSENTFQHQSAGRAGPPKDPWLLEKAHVRRLKHELETRYHAHREPNTIHGHFSALANIRAVREMADGVLEAARVSAEPPPPEIIEETVIWPTEQMSQAMEIVFSWQPDEGQFAPAPLS